MKRLSEGGSRMSEIADRKRTNPPGLILRAGQREFEKWVDHHRVSAFLTRRQFGKTTIASRIALKKMMKRAGHTVIFGSVKLDLAREIVRKEAEAIQTAMRYLATVASAGKTLMEVVDGQSGKSVATLRPDDFADIYESQRLEFRVYHSRSVYSRTKVVALTPAAVGETGDLILDEVGRVKNFRDVWEAVQPIIASHPEFRCILTTTPPPDDAHYSFELLAPPIDWEPKVNPKGNFYRSELGVHVLRVTADDAYADGVSLYDDDTGNAISPEESRRQAPDKDAWDRNYRVKFVLGGTAAIGIMQIDAAQRRGIGTCSCVVVDQDIDFDQAMALLRDKLGAGPVGIGYDVATTEKGTSNPSSITVMERQGIEVIARITVVWKTRDPAIAKERIRTVLETVRDRKEGGRARRMAIDASNEVYFATEVQTEMGDLTMVELVKGGETVEQPGREPITKKALLGNQLVAVFDDNQITVAPHRYIKTDMRLVKRDRGSFACELGANGEHGDTFDSHKLALHALNSTAGGMENTDGMKLGQGRQRRRRVWKPRTKWGRR